MKEITTVIITAIVAIIGGLIPLSCAYLIWSWAMAQIPATIAYAGLLKVLISLALFMVGGGLTIWMTVIATTLAGGLAYAICEYIFD